MRIGQYLCDNPEGGIIYNIDRTKGLEVYENADFAGGWSTVDSENADCVLSRTGFVICYANCPVIWYSKLQTKIALSTAEAGYIAMSHALCETIPIQNLIKEIHRIFDLPNPIRLISISHFTRQFIWDRNGRITEIHTTDEAHSNQISSFPQSSKYIVQIHFNQEAAC
jgi:hypothetical protein